MPPSVMQSAEKAAYLNAVQERLSLLRRKISIVREKLADSLQADNPTAGEQIQQALNAVEKNLASVQGGVNRLVSADDAEWDSIRADVDNSWEALARSIKTVVSRFPDKSIC